MIIAIISVIISFLLDNFLSNITSYSLNSPSLFSTIYTLVILVVLFPHFNNQKKYIIILLITAIFFDIAYTSTFLLNVVIFTIIYFIVKKLNFILPNNLLMANITSLVSIFLYHIITFVILNIVNYNDYTIILLVNILLHSILATVIYTTVMYFILEKIYNIFNIKQIK